MSLDVNGILRYNTEAYEVNNEVLQVKPTLHRLEVRSQASIKFVEHSGENMLNESGLSLFRCFDDNGTEILVDLVTSEVQS